MADLKKIMLDEIRRNPQIQTSLIAETEELIDTELEKTEDNIQAVALAYLDEMGYRRRADNIELAKQMIRDCSEGYDTVIIKKKREVETDLFEKATVAELRDAMEVCLLDSVTTIQNQLYNLTNRQYEYAVEVLYNLYSEDERRIGLGAEDFETFEELLNRYGQEGWEFDTIYSEPVKNGNNRKFVVFKKARQE